MVQTRICSYYRTRCKHVAAAAPATFLSLPEDLRDRIYRDAGVVIGASLRLIGPLPQELNDRICPFFDRVIAAFFCITIGHDEVFLCVDTQRFTPREASDLCFDLSSSNRSVGAESRTFSLLTQRNPDMLRKRLRALGPLRLAAVSGQSAQAIDRPP